MSFEEKDSVSNMETPIELEPINGRSGHSIYYGEIQFDEKMNETASFIRIPNDSKPKKIFQTMKKRWPLGNPAVVISVTGGAKGFHIKDRIESKIKHELIKAVNSTGAWIITGGTRTGVMKMVGDAISEHISKFGARESIVIIGIASFGVIANSGALSQHTVRTSEPILYNATQEDKKVLLDHHHTHFLLVDDGTENQFGGEIEFRTSLENHMMKEVPGVLLVVEGGLNTLKTVLTSVAKDMHVVILKGSGRAADFIAHGFKISTGSKSRSGETSIFPEEFDREMMALAVNIFDFNSIESTENECETIFQLKECLQKRNMLHIYSLEDDKIDLDDTIQNVLFPLFKAKIDLEAQLCLTLLWNRCDIAREEIFNKTSTTELMNIDTKLLLMESLKQNRTEFVKLLLDYVRDLQQITLTDVEELYNKTMDSEFADRPAVLLRNRMLKSQQSWRDFFCCRPVDETISNKHEMLKQVGNFITYLFRDDALNPYKDIKDGKEKSKNRAKDLFIWATLMNRRDVAVLFWKRGSDYTCSALYASALLKRLSRLAYAEEYMKLGASFLENSRYFEKLACNVISELDNKHREISQKLVVKTVKNYGHLTPLTIASSTKLMRFVEQTACQEKLNLIWHGNIASYTSFFKILFCFIIPFFVPTILKHQRRIPSLDKYARTGNHEIRTHDRGLCSCSLTPRVIYYFYSAPITKFILNVLSYLGFLIIFMYFLLIDLHDMSDGGPSLTEIITWVWTVTMITEEARQIWRNEQSSFFNKLRLWFASKGNKTDLLMFVMMIVSIIVRFLIPVEHFRWARLSYSVTMIIFTCRSMQFFFVSKKIGPKVIMVERMMTDFMFFILLLWVFGVAFGVTYQANLFPNSQVDFELFVSIVEKPYWQLYGEIFIDNLKGKEPDPCTDDPTLYLNGTLPRCAVRFSQISVMAGFYMIFMNLILLNALIAMFSYTFQKVQTQSEQVAKFHRYFLVYEYYDRPTLVPPLILVNHIYRAVRYILFKVCNLFPYKDEFKLQLPREESNKIHLFEKDAMEKCMYTASNNKEKIILVPEFM